MFTPQHPLLRTGLDYLGQERWAEATDCFAAASAEAPLESRFLQGYLAYRQQHWEQARADFSAVTATDPDFGAGWTMLGNLELIAGQPALARVHFQRVLDLDPADTGVLLGLGRAWLMENQTDAAIGALLQYRQAHRDDIRAWTVLAQAYDQKSWLFHQSVCLERALALAPEDAEIRYELGRAWNRLGQRGKLAELLAGQLPPTHSEPTDPWRRLLWYLYHYQHLLLAYADPELSDPELFEWVARLPVPAEAPQPPPAPEREQPVRIGYLSPEFCQSVTMTLLWPLLEQHDPAFELYAYDDTPTPDAQSEVLKSYFSGWRRIVGQDNHRVAEQIRQDGIDILVDLTGITNAYRYGVYAQHPAPVQVGGLGFVFSSCCRDLDYCFSDRVLCPPEVEALYPETVVHLSSAFHWQPSASPELSEPPCLSNGFITLGSANTSNKLNLAVIGLWARLLRALPQAVLFLKTPVFDDPLACSFYREFFAHFGIDGTRLRFEGQGSEAHMAYFYPQIDIALDPFPYQGGVTTCEALWMGVPVVSLQQPQWRARALVASILTAMGLEAWLAQSETAYCERVLAWAADLDFLRAQRQALRPRLLASSICDGLGATRAIEAAYRQMWQQARTNQGRTARTNQTRE